MSKIDQLRRWQAKLQRQILQQETEEPCKSFRDYLSTGDSTILGYPPVLCPVCGEAVCVGIGSPNTCGDGWEHLSTDCPACGTHLRLGEISDRCALCHQPFLLAPYDDINQLHHHRCSKDGESYCTPCFMQLFFDGYIDLSSGCPQLTDASAVSDYEIPDDYLPTYVGKTVAPFRSRLTANGYEEVALAGTWDEMRQICHRVAEEGRRYLVLSCDRSKSEQEQYYIIYLTRAKAGGSS